MVRRSHEVARSLPYRVLSVWIAALVVGCAGAKPKLAAVEPAPGAGTVAQLAAGESFAVQRPTPGAARLSLWIAAGARDATPPQLALAAALWAGQKQGLRPRVLAEGTEFSVLCDTTRAALDACAARLVTVLDPGVPSAADAVRVRERVRGQRERAAQDAGRRAEQLALEALLGDGASGLFPLGAAADDARIDAAALRDFIARHYAASRALLLGLGDVTKQRLAPAAQRMKARNLAARPQRALTAREGLRVEAADSGQIALVVTSASVERAASLCERFRAIHADARAHISSLRGVTLAHLLLPAGELPFARLQSAVFDLRRLFIEPSRAAPAPPPDSLDGLAQSIGEAWVVRDASGQAAEGQIGVALLWPREDRGLEAGGDALEKIRARAGAAIEAGTRHSAPKADSAGAGLVRRLATDNGARLEFVRRPGERWFAAGVRFRGGSGADAATGHGRAALLATLMADGCGMASGRALDLRLSTLQARLWPMVDARGLGVGVSAPAAHAEEALDLLLRCALRPAFQARALEDARARLLRSLWQDDGHKLAALLGQLLTPGAPGTVAPWGTPAGIAKVELTELRRLHAQLLRGPLISLFATGDAAGRELLEFAARRLAYLGDSASEPAAAQTGPSTDMAAAQDDGARLRVLIGLSGAGPGTATLGAQVFASALSRALAARIGEAGWSLGIARGERAYAGVALSVREDQLEGLNREVEAALRELRDKPDAQFRLALDQARLAQSAALSSARGWVEASFAGRPDANLALEAELAQIRNLAHARPSYLVLRPRS